MSISDELRDPWGWLLAAISGGLAWAVLSDSGALAVAAGLAVAAAVLATKVVVGAAVHRDRSELPTAVSRDALPAPLAGSPAAAFVGRAEAARSRMARLAQLPGDPWLRGEVERMDDGADEVVHAMRDLAGRVALADQLLASGNRAGLMHDRSALAEQVGRSGDPMLAEERRRALAAVDEQLASLDRVAGLREQLLTRMQTAALGLETIATRMGEVVAMGTASMEHDSAGQALQDAGADLEALRTGLAEAQRLARGVGPR